MIRLEDLRVDAGAFSLQIEDLTLRAGEYVVIVGPTGSGKTVLLETVAGMRRPIQGRVWFGDRDVTREPPERRRTGFVYQDYALFPHLTVAGNIAFGLRAGRKAERAAQVERLASLLGIQGLLDRYPEGLSGGERQRVALARALAIEPEVLLLDEPLSALDRTTRRELRDGLKRLHDGLQATVLHVTHDLDEALALGERVAVVIDGRLRQIGPPGEVVRRPADGDVAQLVGMSNVFSVDAATPVEGGVRLVLRGRAEAGSDGRLELVAASSAGEGVDGRVLAVVPAEEIVLLAGEKEQDGVGFNEGAWSQNRVEGIIRDVQIQSVHACLQVEAPLLLSVHVLRPEVARAGLSVGSRVSIRIPPEAIHICRAVSPASPPRDRRQQEM